MCHQFDCLPWFPSDMGEGGMGEVTRLCSCRNLTQISQNIMTTCLIWSVLSSSCQTSSDQSRWGQRTSEGVLECFFYQDLSKGFFRPCRLRGGSSCTWLASHGCYQISSDWYLKGSGVRGTPQARWNAFKPFLSCFCKAQCCPLSEICLLREWCCHIVWLWGVIGRQKCFTRCHSEIHVSQDFPSIFPAE